MVIGDEQGKYQLITQTGRKIIRVQAQGFIGESVEILFQKVNVSKKFHPPFTISFPTRKQENGKMEKSYSNE